MKGRGRHAYRYAARSWPVQDQLVSWASTIITCIQKSVAIELGDTIGRLDENSNQTHMLATAIGRHYKLLWVHTSSYFFRKEKKKMRSRHKQNEAFGRWRPPERFWREASEGSRWWFRGCYVSEVLVTENTSWFSQIPRYNYIFFNFFWEDKTWNNQANITWGSL